MVLSKKLRQTCALSAIVFFSLGIQGVLADDEGPCCRDNAHPRWYAAISGSAVFLNETDYNHPDFNTTNLPDAQSHSVGYGIGAAVGYQLFSGVRSEVEIMDRHNQAKELSSITVVIPSGDEIVQRSTAYMFNTYVDMHNSTLYTPYIGAGVGEDFVITPRNYGNTNKVSGWANAYQLMTGVSYEFKLDNNPAEFSIGYRYFNSNLSAKVDGAPGSIKASNTSNSIELGGRYYFQ